MRNRYKGRHRREPYGESIGQITVQELRRQTSPTLGEIWWNLQKEIRELEREKGLL